MNASADIVIIGGGIAGLAAAQRLERTAPGISAVLLERDTRVGGWVQTERSGGFTIESGPDSFLSTKPAGMRLSEEVGLAGRLEGVDEETRATFIMRDAVLYPLPQGLSGLVPARLRPLFASPLLSPAGKARVALEQAVRARQGADDESLGRFMRRRFGREAYERMIEPLMSGIYGGNGDALSVLATFPQLRRLELEHGSVLRGIKRSSGPPSGGARPSPFVAPIEGMGALPEAVRAGLSRTVIGTGVTATAIEAADGGYVVNGTEGLSLPCRAAVIATPAFVTGTLLSTLDPDLGQLHAQIAYGSTATVSLGFPRDAVRQDALGHGYIIPRRESRPLMAVTFSSRKFKHRAPSGALLVRGFVRVSGGADRLPDSDDEMAGLLRDELRQTCDITAEPEVCRVFRLPRSMPQYAVGHVDRVAQIEGKLQALPGIFLAGAAYRGVGIPDCIASGWAAADGAAAYLSGPPENLVS
jgi:oxygen-dependent protoporphyrinogen oxidase